MPRIYLTCMINSSNSLDCGKNIYELFEVLWFFLSISFLAFLQSCFMTHDFRLYFLFCLLSLLCQSSKNEHHIHLIIFKTKHFNLHFNYASQQLLETLLISSTHVLMEAHGYSVISLIKLLTCKMPILQFHNQRHSAGTMSIRLSGQWGNPTFYWCIIGGM